MEGGRWGGREGEEGQVEEGEQMPMRMWARLGDKEAIRQSPTSGREATAEPTSGDSKVMAPPGNRRRAGVKGSIDRCRHVRQERCGRKRCD